MKKETEKDSKKQGPKEPNGKEKVTDVTTKQDTSKLLPWKSIKATPNSLILDSSPKHIEDRDALALAEAAVEVERKMESTKKHKAQNQPMKIKGKGIAENTKQMIRSEGKEVKKTSKKEKEKSKDKLTKKRKTKLE